MGLQVPKNRLCTKDQGLTRHLEHFLIKKGKLGPQALPVCHLTGQSSTWISEMRP